MKKEQLIPILVTVFWLAVIILALLSGCTTTKYVTVPEYHYRDSVKTQTVRDSVFLHDSIFQSVFTKGDTVFNVKYKWQTKWRDRLVHDTLYASARDTIRVFYPETTEKLVYAMRWYEKMFMRIGIAATGAFVAFIAAWLIKRKRIV